MILSKKAIEKIKKIVENRYNHLLVESVGADVLSDEELDKLRAAGYDISNEESLLELIYYNNVLNDLADSKGPISIGQMRRQQESRPKGNAHKAAEEHVNENFAHLLEKHKNNMLSRIEGIIRDTNNDYRNDALQNLNRTEEIDQLVKESSVGKIKQRLKDISGEANRNWERIAITETSNAIGIGSVDRVISQNKETPADEIYVYRIPVNDAALCKFCRRFYLDSDQTPALYKLSSLLNNGTNYGKKTVDWKPVVGATHPNDRESGVMELRRGWKVGPDGNLEYIGEEKWDEYISKKLRY